MAENQDNINLTQGADMNNWTNAEVTELLHNIIPNQSHNQGPDSNVTNDQMPVNTINNQQHNVTSSQSQQQSFGPDGSVMNLNDNQFKQQQNNMCNNMSADSSAINNQYQQQRMNMNQNSKTNTMNPKQKIMNNKVNQSSVDDVTTTNSDQNEEKKSTNQQQNNMNNSNETQNMNNNNNMNQSDKEQKVKNKMNMVKPYFCSLTMEEKKDEAKLTEINDHKKPNGQPDQLNCIQHTGSTKSGKKIKECLQYLLDHPNKFNPQKTKLEVAKIAERLKIKCKYSCIVWEDLNLESMMDIGGIEGAISTWLLTDKDGDIVIASYRILILDAQKADMKTGNDASNSSEKDIESCVEFLRNNNESEINVATVAKALEEKYKYSCFVWDDLDLQIGIEGIETKEFSTCNINDKDYHIRIINKVIKQKNNMKTGAEI